MEAQHALFAPDARPILLFDGVCNLCNAAVNFIIDRDPQSVFRFAPLQSAIGRELAERSGVDPEVLSSFVLVEGDRVYVRSTAALHVALRLSGLWPLAYAFVAIPVPLRDAVYDYIAANRYRWFGQRDTCRLPTPAERARFLDYTLPTA